MENSDIIKAAHLAVEQIQDLTRTNQTLFEERDCLQKTINLLNLDIKNLRRTLSDLTGIESNGTVEELISKVLKNYQTYADLYKELKEGVLKFLGNPEGLVTAQDLIKALNKQKKLLDGLEALEKLKCFLKL